VKKRLLWGALVLLLVVMGLLAYVAVPAADKLYTVRDILDQPLGEISDEEGDRAMELLDEAQSDLTSPAARAISWIPVIRQNISALDDTAGEARPALATGLTLRREADRMRQEGLLEDGRIPLERIAELDEPLNDQLRALERLQATLRDTRSGWLLPPLWDTIGGLSRRVETFTQDAQNLQGLLDVLGPLLGTSEKRTYLVLLLNNAELRGAGGILAGVGTLRAEEGTIEIGGFTSVHSLTTDRLQTVESPPGYGRFEKYGANSTTFVNATYSPDVPDDAVVAARLYEKTTGVRSDGALVVDPRGIAALLPPDAQIETPFEKDSIDASALPRFVYSDAYQSFEDQAARRDALIEMGKDAFDQILATGLKGERVLRAAGRAVAAGHLRFVPFEKSEAEAVEATGATGSLPSEVDNTLLVTFQNKGGGGPIGSKMDYWAKRSVSHGCEVSEDTARCATEVTIENVAPPGLVDYVTGASKPYGLVRGALEVYVPRDARITSVKENGESPIYSLEEQEDLKAIGVDIQAEPGRTTTVIAGYEIPLNGDFTMKAVPQPLARDARVEILLKVPDEWLIEGPGKLEDDTFIYEGNFVGTLSINTRPEEDAPGLPGLWDSISNFMNDPVL
jgi:Protein of unknown function (DUF4012)